MSVPAYPAARKIAPDVYEYFKTHREAAGEETVFAPLPDTEVIESIIDVAFWTSLRREENFPPRISLTYLAPEEDPGSLIFEKPLPLQANALTKIAPGVERPGIHLGVWRIDGELKVWGATRHLPVFSFITQTVAPGVIVIKHRHSDEAAKFINVAVLEGDQTKVLNHEFLANPSCVSILSSLLGATTASSNSSNILIRLAVSMRNHRRGGSLLVVPRESLSWRKSIVHPISYSVDPSYTELSEIIKEVPEDKHRRRWKDALGRAIDAVAGLTAIDGATVINQDCAVLAFGAKIMRPEGIVPAEQVSLVEPVEGSETQIVNVTQLGGTRHLSAVQFANAQRDAIAMVASQDGPFTIFSWSECDNMVLGYRVEALLL